MHWNWTVGKSEGGNQPELTGNAAKCQLDWILSVKLELREVKPDSGCAVLSLPENDAIWQINWSPPVPYITVRHHRDDLAGAIGIGDFKFSCLLRLCPAGGVEYVELTAASGDRQSDFTGKIFPEHDRCFFVVLCRIDETEFRFSDRQG